MSGGKYRFIENEIQVPPLKIFRLISLVFHNNDFLTDFGISSPCASLSFSNYAHTSLSVPVVSHPIPRSTFPDSSLALNNSNIFHGSVLVFGLYYFKSTFDELTYVFPLLSEKRNQLLYFFLLLRGPIQFFLLPQTLVTAIAHFVGSIGDPPRNIVPFQLFLLNQLFQQLILLLGPIGFCFGLESLSLVIVDEVGRRVSVSWEEEGVRGGVRKERLIEILKSRHSQSIQNQLWANNKGDLKRGKLADIDYRIGVLFVGLHCQQLQRRKFFSAQIAQEPSQFKIYSRRFNPFGQPYSER